MGHYAYTRREGSTIVILGVASQTEALRIEYAPRGGGGTLSSLRGFGWAVDGSGAGRCPPLLSQQQPVSENLWRRTQMSRKEPPTETLACTAGAMSPVNSRPITGRFYPLQPPCSSPLARQADGPAPKPLRIYLQCVDALLALSTRAMLRGRTASLACHAKRPAARAIGTRSPQHRRHCPT